MGPSFDRNSESFLVGSDPSPFYAWLEYVAGIKPPYNRDGAPEPEAPPSARTRSPPSSLHAGQRRCAAYSGS
jgi:hypothetical protein